ncbi:hypothetical protein BDV19DRAFT_251245 [Aspergillus venezuelensis]
MAGLFDRFFGIRRPKGGARVTRLGFFTGTPWTESEKNRVLRLRAEFPGHTWRQFQQRFFPKRNKESVSRRWRSLKAKDTAMDVAYSMDEASPASCSTANAKQPSPSPPPNTARQSKIARISDSESDSEYGNKERSDDDDDSGESDPEAGDIGSDGVTRRLRYPLRSMKIKKAFEPESKDEDNRVHAVEAGEDGQPSKSADSPPIANEEIPSAGGTSRIDAENPNFIPRKPSSTLQKPMVVVCVPTSLYTHALDNPNSSSRPPLSVTGTASDFAKDERPTAQPSTFQGEAKHHSAAIKYGSSGSCKARRSSIPIYQAAPAPRRSIRSISTPGPNELGYATKPHAKEYEHIIGTFTIRKSGNQAKQIGQSLPTSASSNAPTNLPFVRRRNTLPTSGPVAETNPSTLSSNRGTPTAQFPDRAAISQDTTAKSCPTPESITASNTRQQAPRKTSPLAPLSQKSIEDTKSSPHIRHSTAKAGIVEKPRISSISVAKVSLQLPPKPLTRQLLTAKATAVASSSANPDPVQAIASNSKQQDSIQPVHRSPSIPNILTQVQEQAAAEYNGLQTYLEPLISRAKAARARFDKASELKAKLAWPETFLASDLMELNSFLAQTRHENRHA